MGCNFELGCTGMDDVVYFEQFFEKKGVNTIVVSCGQMYVQDIMSWF